MINKFNIGDLVTSNRGLGLGIITDKSHSTVGDEMSWYYLVHFDNGWSDWLHERALTSEITANK